MLSGWNLKPLRLPCDSTIGYGDRLPYTATEIKFVMFAEIFGLAFFALLVCNNHYIHKGPFAAALLASLAAAALPEFPPRLLVNALSSGAVRIAALDDDGGGRAPQVTEINNVNEVMGLSTQDFNDRKNSIVQFLKANIPNDPDLIEVRAPQHGLSSNTMALITSDYDAMRLPEHQMALIASGCVRQETVRYLNFRASTL